jgi:hypothetical protein
MESGYRLAIVLTIVFDSLATVFLAVLILSLAQRYHRTSRMRPTRLTTNS